MAAFGIDLKDWRDWLVVAIVVVMLLATVSITAISVHILSVLSPERSDGEPSPHSFIDGGTVSAHVCRLFEATPEIEIPPGSIMPNLVVCRCPNGNAFSAHAADGRQCSFPQPAVRP